MSTPPKPENRPDPAASVKTLKLAMSAVVGIVTAMHYSGLIESEATDTATSSSTPFLIIFGLVAVAVSIFGYTLAKRARTNNLATAVPAAASFEVIALLGFVYGMVDDAAPQWLMAAAAGIALFGIWVVVPNKIQKVL